MSKGGDPHGGRNLKLLLIVPGIVLLICLALPSYRANQPPAKTQTSTAEGYYEQGKKDLQANRCGEAVDAFKKAIAIEPASGPYNDLGRAYDCLDKEAEAEASFKQAIRLNPNNTSALFNLGFEYAHHVKIEAAKNVLLELKRKDPERAKKLEVEIEVAYEAERAEAAGLALFADHDSKKYLAEGEKYRQSKDYLRAIESDKKSVSIKPSSDAYNELGLSYLALKQYPNAVLAFQQAIQLEATDPILHYNLAKTYLEMGQYEKSGSSAREALRLKPDDAEAVNLLGVAHGRLKEYVEAITEFQRAIRLAPENGRFYHNLGKTYFLMGRRADAQLVYKKLLNLDRVWAQELYEVINPPPAKTHD